MGILDKVTSAAKSATDKTKPSVDVGNLKTKILYEEERIVEIFTEMGKSFYKDPDGDHSKLRELCDDIDTRRRRILKMRLELNQVKGFKICPKCGMKLTDKFVYCGKCGTKLPDVSDENFSVLEMEGFYNEG
ncbi:MAG: zinc ribbon domain-containing protein [Ruminococcus sp.]|nr:zinc ribbon domain-containing protein [Ruminococcus sp.]